MIRCRRIHFDTITEWYQCDLSRVCIPIHKPIYKRFCFVTHNYNATEYCLSVKFTDTNHIFSEHYLNYGYQKKPSLNKCEKLIDNRLLSVQLYIHRCCNGGINTNYTHIQVWQLCIYITVWVWFKIPHICISIFIQWYYENMYFKH